MTPISAGEAYLEAALISNENGDDDKANHYLVAAEKAPSQNNEKLQLEVSALRDRLDGEQDRALEKYQALADRYPDDASVQYYLADLALELDRPEDAKKAVENCLRQEPLNAFCNFESMMVQVYENQFQQVLRSHESLSAKNVNYAWFDEPVDLALFGLDKLNEALLRFERLGSVNRSVHGLVHFVAAKEWRFDIESYQGRLGAANEHIEQLVLSERPYARADHLLSLAEQKALVGEIAGARSAVHRALMEFRDPGNLIDAATTLAIIGDRTEVEKILSQMTANGLTAGETEDGATKLFIHGSLLLAEGRTAEAIKDLTGSYELDQDCLTEFQLARAYMRVSGWNLAVARLTNMVHSKGIIISQRPSILWPLAHYYLAVSYDNMGQKLQASSYYSKFLDIWSTADVDLKPVLYSKKRLALLAKERPTDQRVHCAT